MTSNETYNLDPYHIHPDTASGTTSSLRSRQEKQQCPIWCLLLMPHLLMRASSSRWTALLGTPNLISSANCWIVCLVVLYLDILITSLGRGKEVGRASNVAADALKCDQIKIPNWYPPRSVVTPCDIQLCGHIWVSIHYGGICRDSFWFQIL